MKIKISFFAIMLFLSLILSGAHFALIPLFAALIHELGHIITAKILKVKLNSFNIGIFGARISISNGIYSYADEILVCAAGPIANFLSAYAAAIIKRLSGDSIISELFILSSISLGIINLLPIHTFDGGRILFSAISKISDPYIAEKVLSVISFLILFFLWCISLYLLLRTSASLSLFVFSLSIFANIFIEKQ